MNQCAVVELWVISHYTVKFNDMDPIKKAILSCRRCVEQITHECVSAEGFRFRLCAGHAFERVCGAEIVSPGEPTEEEI